MKTNLPPLPLNASYAGILPGSRGRARGFTLVEVVMALGILSFGLIGMMGLLSAGLQTFREAKDSSTEARIVQLVATQLAQADFSKIRAAKEELRYFSREGVEITGAGAEKDAIYSATISQPEKLRLPGATAVPGNVLTFVISISSPSNRKNKKLFPIQVANYGA